MMSPSFSAFQEAFVRACTRWLSGPIPLTSRADADQSPSTSATTRSAWGCLRVLDCVCVRVRVCGNMCGLEGISVR